jgi:hypothetical protein
VFLVTWSQPARPDWAAVLVRAHEPDEALAIAAEAHRERFRPQLAVPAAEPVARAVIAGESLPVPSRLRVLE